METTQTANQQANNQNSIKHRPSNKEKRNQAKHQKQPHSPNDIKQIQKTSHSQNNKKGKAGIQTPTHHKTQNKKQKETKTNTNKQPSSPN